MAFIDRTDTKYERERESGEDMQQRVESSELNLWPLQDSCLSKECSWEYLVNIYL